MSVEKMSNGHLKTCYCVECENLAIEAHYRRLDQIDAEAEAQRQVINDRVNHGQAT